MSLDTGAVAWLKRDALGGPGLRLRPGASDLILFEYPDRRGLHLRRSFRLIDRYSANFLGFVAYQTGGAP
jgi:hypothetical protein